MRGERGVVVYSVPLLDRIGENVGRDDTGKRGGIRCDSVAVIVRLVTSDKR